MLREKQVLSTELLFHEDYKTEQTKTKFWDLSYRCGVDYIDGKDARNKPLLKKFRCEEDDDYIYRKDVTKPRNHVGNILNKMNGYVFRTPAERPEQDQKYIDFTNNASLSGETIDKVMKRGLLYAQIEGKSYLVADHTNTSAEVKTLAQARADGDRPFIRVVRTYSVINWSENDNILTEIAILYTDENGQKFVRYYDEQYVQDFYVDEDDNIVSIGTVIPHNYPTLPVVVLKPDFANDSQAESLSELQQELTFWLSLLNVEGTKNVYTLHTFTGVLPPDYNDESKTSNRAKFSMGTNSIVYLGEQGSLNRMGADTSACTVLMDVINKVEEAIYRQAGIAAGNPLAQSGNPQSGLSKIFDQKDLASILLTLADAAEYAENKITDIIFRAESNMEVMPARYDKAFDIPDYEQDLNEIEMTSNLKIPNIIKRKAINGFISTFFDLTEEERVEYEAELMNLYPDDTAEPSDETIPPVGEQQEPTEEGEMTPPEEGVTIEE